MRVMTVCTGNICRSPMAEVVLRVRLGEAGLGGVVVHSTGVSDEEAGHPIDPRARRALLAHGYPGGDGHRARQVRAADLSGADLVLAMTGRHVRALRALAGRTDAAFADRVELYRRFDPAAGPADGRGAAAGALDLADPWYGGDAEFELALAQIEAAAGGIVRHVAALAGGPGASSSS